MAGNKIGGSKASETNRAKYGEDFYKRIGAMGGRTQTEDTRYKGFASMSFEQVSAAGRKGGMISRRRKNG